MSNSIIDHQRDQDLFNPFIIYKPKPLTNEVREKLLEQMSLLSSRNWIMISESDDDLPQIIPL